MGFKYNPIKTGVFSLNLNKFNFKLEFYSKVLTIKMDFQILMIQNKWVLINLFLINIYAEFYRISSFKRAVEERNLLVIKYFEVMGDRERIDALDTLKRMQTFADQVSWVVLLLHLFGIYVLVFNYFYLIVMFALIFTSIYVLLFALYSSFIRLKLFGFHSEF